MRADEYNKNVNLSAQLFVQLVRTAQRAIGLTPDGKLGPQTSLRLELHTMAKADASELVTIALTQKGLPYRFGVETAPDMRPLAHDCSELIEWVCAQACVYPRMPDGSWNQAKHCLDYHEGVLVPYAMGTAGALLFKFSENPYNAQQRPRIAHVEISLGDGRTFGARSTTDGCNIFPPRHDWTHAARIPGVAY